MKKVGIIALAALCTIGAAAVAYASRNDGKTSRSTDEELLMKELVAAESFGKDVAADKTSDKVSRRAAKKQRTGDMIAKKMPETYQK